MEGPLLKAVQKRITPASDSLSRQASQMLRRIDLLLKDAGLAAEAVLGGSVAKGTHLKDDSDVDIFVRFSLDQRELELSQRLGEALRPLRPARIHGSRDYYQVMRGKVTYEIVPVLAVKDPSQAQNVTDMSYLHVQWALTQLRRRPGLRGDIRLAKQFCKAARVYGAESYIKGFSGHSLDVLVIHFRGFRRFLQAAVRWKGQTLIDCQDAHHGQARERLNPAKVQGPLVLVDPVDPLRNAAAALDDATLARFQQRAREFLKSPHQRFFVRPRFSIPALRRRAAGRRLILMEVTPRKDKVDIAGAKLVKAFEQLTRQLKLQDFVVHECDWEWEKGQRAYYWFLLDPQPLSASKEHSGPPVGSKQHVDAFLARHPQAYVRENRYYAIIERPFTDARQLLKQSIGQDPQLMSRVARVRLV